ncbi:MAG: DUF1080 domain-containing protein [Verrucomicrobia bacterium]|nr:DUF1080 domain-containing protein [Verrucomicrobiota bacterium]
MVSCALAAIFSISGLAADEPAPRAGFVSLFNGKNLDGWTTRQPNTGDWTVVDGVIDCDPKGEAKGDRELWSVKYTATSSCSWTGGSRRRHS